MPSEGMSDERIGVSVLRGVIREELEELPPYVVQPLSLPLETQKSTYEQQEKAVAQLVQIIGDKLKDDVEVRDAIDGLKRCCLKSKKFNFALVLETVFVDSEITWEKIAALFYVAGKLVVTMVKACLPQLVTDILTSTLEYFRKRLLAWIGDHGGWPGLGIMEDGFAELACWQVERMPPMGRQATIFTLVFLGGILLGSFITSRMAKGT